ncbi:MAG: hypothetical protein HYT70_00740 [Candidatus Aenigmarchaeota archaeon]|nr:hypothetical protein [Candidatus Aenigmarchaeota archaeon]
MKLKMKLPKELEVRVLTALYKYYTKDVTFERAAEDENIPIVLFVNYVNDNDLPIVHTDKDMSVGIQRVLVLMKERGMKVDKLRLSA